MMNFNEFEETLKMELERKTSVEKTEYDKYGYGKITAFILGDGTQRPAFYPHIIYTDYYKTGIFNMEQIVEWCVGHVENIQTISCPKSKKELLSLVFPRLLCKDKFHGEIYKEILWSNDMIMTYCCELGFSAEKEKNASFVIGYDMMKRFDISMEELEHSAMDNLKKMDFYIDQACDLISDPNLLFDERNRKKIEYSMEPISCDFEKKENGFPFFKVADKENWYGVKLLLRKDILQMLYEYFGGSYFIIPSSIHECIVLPLNKNDMFVNAKMLKEIIREVNTYDLKAEEILSNGLYLFDGAKIKEI